MDVDMADLMETPLVQQGIGTDIETHFESFPELSNLRGP